jgi:hypothetical protein
MEKDHAKHTDKQHSSLVNRDVTLALSDSSEAVALKRHALG